VKMITWHSMGGRPGDGGRKLRSAGKERSG
jgi:hypothetical protein